MKIVIAGGREEADFLIASLLSKKFLIKIINADKNYCKYLSDKYYIPVLHGDPSKEYILEDADIYNFDVLIALNSNDADNFVTCQIARKKFGINRVVCTVNNPVNVEIFQKLGINTAISSAYIVAKSIEHASTVEGLVNRLSSEDEAFSLSEFIVEEDSYCANKSISSLKMPKNSRITCVIHNGKMVIPTGQTVIHTDDKVLLLSSKESHEEAINALMEEKKDD